jgi:hypothetical protein
MMYCIAKICDEIEYFWVFFVGHICLLGSFFDSGDVVLSVTCMRNKNGGENTHTPTAYSHITNKEAQQKPILL